METIKITAAAFNELLAAKSVRTHFVDSKTAWKRTLYTIGGGEDVTKYNKMAVSSDLDGGLRMVKLEIAESGEGV